MSQPDYSALAKDFISLWQQQLSNGMHDQSFIRAMADAIQQFQGNTMMASTGKPFSKAYTDFTAQKSEEHRNHTWNEAQHAMQHNFDQGVDTMTQMMQQGLANMRSMAGMEEEEYDADSDTPPDDASYDSELAWIKQRLAACEARIALLESEQRMAERESLYRTRTHSQEKRAKRFFEEDY